MTTLGRITDLFVYPVKALGGVRVERSAVGDLGLARDRRWMLVEPDGTFLTQRDDPHLALARATPTDDGFTVTAPGLEPLSVGEAPHAARRLVTVWGDTVEASTYPATVDAWFSTHVGRPVHLVYMADDVRRPVDPTYATPDDRTAFTDGFPVLVVSRESLGDLNARLTARGETPVGIERFRPNVVVDGTSGAYAEDDWRDVQAGDAVLGIVKPCGRCVVTTIDPATGTKSARGEPLRTLATYRTRNGKVVFTQNALVRRGGTLAVGDAVREA